MNTIQIDIQNSVQLLDRHISDLFSKFPHELTVSFPPSLTMYSPSVIPSNPVHLIKHVSIPDTITDLNQRNRDLEETMNEMQEEEEETNSLLSQTKEDLEKCKQKVNELKSQVLEARTQKVDGFSLQLLPLEDFASNVKMIQEKRNKMDNWQRQSVEMQKGSSEEIMHCQQLEHANHMLEQV